MCTTHEYSIGGPCCGPLMGRDPQFENHCCITYLIGIITLITEQDLLIMDFQRASGPMGNT